MKRWQAGLSLALVLMVAGCGNPAGTDGDLVDDWSALGAPAVPVPTVGQCWTGTATAEKLEPGAGMTAVGCDADHASETFHVGEFTGTLAQASAPPTGADLSEAYQTCDEKAKTFLNGDWHDARLVLRVFTPSAKQWTGEARHFRCDLIEVSNDVGTVFQRKSSLKATLDGSRPIALGCVSVKLDSQSYIEDFVPVACETQHNGEYAGTFRSPDDRPYPTDANTRRSLIQPGCKKLIASFLGVSEAAYDQNKQVTFAWSTASPTRWSYGDRTARCYLMLEGKLSVGRSLRANGNNPI
ncbi:septum formation family protein [Dactylosporangium roseum]|uniref:Septum formation family protein n=1 Tax=Dactylosporangium roseum TaxID=47989 RepID=A0ABY5Z4P8_9ACTN|nr:septum formation family protein [Dactylosporangium roseum]UWZ36986.1 septum formation family protein [Dactylosporangium roseum]